MSSELKPCPFCGKGDPGTISMVEEVTCRGCGLMVDRQLWNRRVLPADVREALEEIAEGATEPGTPMWIAVRAREALSAYPEAPEEKACESAALVEWEDRMQRIKAHQRLDETRRVGPDGGER